MTMIERLPPHDIEAEDAIVATMLVRPERIPEIASIVKPADFFREKNGWAVSAALAVYERDGAAGVHQASVAHELARRDLLEAAGGQAWMADCVRLAIVDGGDFYPEIVHRAALYRRMISAASRIAQLAYEAPEDAVEAMDRATELLLSVNPERVKSSSQSFREALDGGLSDWFERHMANPHQLSGMSTGIALLDYLLDGYQRGSVYVIAAETSVGKSLFVMDQAIWLANEGMASLLFSSEMSAASVFRRGVFALAGVDRQAMRRAGYYPDDKRRAILDGEARGYELPITVCNPGGLTVAGIRGEVRRLQARGPLDVVVIDHIDHVSGGSGRRVSDLEEIMRDLKAMAEKLDVVLIVVSHLSRPSLTGGKISRLKNSSSKEQDADVVMFLQPVEWVEGQWAELSQESAQIKRSQQGYLDVRLEVYKNREGMTGFVPLRQSWDQGGRFVALEQRRTA